MVSVMQQILPAPVQSVPLVQGVAVEELLDEVELDVVDEVVELDVLEDVLVLEDVVVDEVELELVVAADELVVAVEPVDDGVCVEPVDVVELLDGVEELDPEPAVQSLLSLQTSTSTPRQVSCSQGTLAAHGFPNVHSAAPPPVSQVDRSAHVPSDAGPEGAMQQ
jgi:hypothetical protein